jgi:hypothetical protein
LKRRQRYRWAGLLSFEKRMEQDADSVPRGGRQYSNHDNREWIARSCVVLEPAHAEKQHAREPGDLLHVLANRPRPVREGHEPNGGHERTGEVGLCRSTSEPAEQRRAAAFGGGWGGKGTDCGEHRSITHASDTERVAHVPGMARCAASSTFRRHSSTVRAVCVKAPVRICAGGDQRWSSLPRQVWSAAELQAKSEERQLVCANVFGLYNLDGLVKAFSDFRFRERGIDPLPSLFSASRPGRNSFTKPRFYAAATRTGAR